MNASASEKMFALQWWKELGEFAQEELRQKYYCKTPMEAIIRYPNMVIEIYRRENK